ncbi:Structural maintenance of chromosomes protein 4 [Hypsibius exemplaris]|uniref:Structural maintenance of chromosomes protein n=1 Tax=Hypsibius exemplaris TaxID=2072580 RepID=A0A9X6NF20_HYPEX|nr:Structural maintenance of chromosomes protein 4 [Hypsibius exemplaris]
MADPAFSEESEWTRETGSPQAEPSSKRAKNGSSLNRSRTLSPRNIRNASNGHGSEGSAEGSPTSPSTSDVDDNTVIAASPNRTAVSTAQSVSTFNVTTEARIKLPRKGKVGKKSEDDLENVPSSLITPEPLRSTPKARESYRAGCRSLGLDADEAGSARDKAEMADREKMRGMGSPDPSLRGSLASHNGTQLMDQDDEMSTALHIPDESFAAPEPGPAETKDEYCAEADERQQFLLEHGIAMPAPVETFRQRYNANKSEQRLVLESLHLENFKSYANKVAVGAFNPKFTCIIGPNGSGKSNTIDALLFVFGYNNKRIRASKTADLIHKSDKFPNFKFCRVTVTFKRIIPGVDNYNQKEVEGSRYTVAREADHRGGSFFMLDGKKVDRAAVRARLLRDGIDLDQNRFLILQGEVEQIAMMKPKAKRADDEEMLEYVEEIVGTNQYKEPIAQLDALVDKLACQEEQQNMKVHEFGKQMNSLEAVKNETERYLKAENDVITRQHIIGQVHRYQHAGKREAAQAKLKIRQDDLTAKEADLAGLVIARKTLEEEHEAKKMYIREMEKGDSVEEKVFGTVEARKTKMQTKKKTLEESIPKIEAAKEKLEDQLKSKEDAPERLQEEIQTITQDIDNTKSNLELYARTIREKTTALPGLIGDRPERAAALEARLAEARVPLNGKRVELDNKDVEFNAFRDKHIREVQRHDDMVRRQTELTAETATLTEARGTISRELPPKEQELTQLRPRVQALRQNGETLTRDIRAKQDEIVLAAAQSRIQTNNRILRALLEAQRDGHLEGIIGRLGDLGTIDAKYDVAISTNFGGRLDTILVADVPASKRVIQYLKDNNLGRVSMFVLDKVTASVQGSVNQPFRTPEHSQRFIDLITPQDPIYRPIFYYSVRDTLVTDTRDRAVEIAYGRTKHKAVSLDGTQVDGVSGAMSGGGDSVTRGKMRTNAQGFQQLAYSGPPLEELEGQCRVLEARLQTNQTDLAECEIRLTDLQREIAQLTQAGTGNADRLRDFTAELDRLRDDIVKQARVVEESTPDAARQAVFERAIAALKAELEVENDRVQKIQDDIDVINGQIVDITKRNVDEWSTKERKAKTSLTRLEKELLAKQNEFDNHGKAMKKLRQDIEKRTTELAEKQTELEALLTEMDTVEAEWIAARDELKQKKELLKADKSEEKAMMERINNFDGKIEQLENETQEYRALVHQAKSEVEGVRKKMEALEKELDGLKLNDLHSAEPAQIKILSPEALCQVEIAELEGEIAGLKVQMNLLQPKLNVLQEYYKLADSRDGIMRGVEEIRRKRKLGYTLFMDYKNRRFTEFMDALRVIQSVLKTTYRQLTLGGDASLEPLDRFDPFADGLEFMVKPKTKSWKNISYLSGGEKTISSLALIFALHYFKPTPFYIMDEIDAALDFRNTSVIAFFVKERALAAQFIIVSLRNQMFECAYRLIGICKPDHQSMAMFIDPAKHVVDETETEPRQTIATFGRTASMYSQATQGPLLQGEEDEPSP